ncbi:MAG: DUF3108 domain-containing protein [Candidatus Symbiothrix sp.]|nr:DUF3108 domain-containing protein [Candidatus Symbiothrix sp.]
MILVLAMGRIPLANAQIVPFQSGEELNFTIHYKYGLVVVKAGTAVYRLQTETYNQQPALKTALNFKTTSFVDNVIMTIRDTMYSYATLPAITPLAHFRNIHEGSHSYYEETWIQKHTTTTAEAKVKQTQEGTVKKDTLLTASKESYDFLNMFLYIRNLDYGSMQVGDTRLVAVLMGTKVVYLTIRYGGQTVLEGKHTEKNNAVWWTVDLTDKIFAKSKNAMEIWISDDENHVPLKLKAQLKIGTAVAILSSYKNLKNGDYRY